MTDISLPTVDPAALARLALDNIRREYPYAAHHVQTGPEDNLPPGQLHPSFAGSFDWHSSVHMHFLLVSLVDACPPDAQAPWREEALAVLKQHLAPGRIAAEAAYLRNNPAWERPYGWAWATQLVAALHTAADPALRSLTAGALPLAEAVFANTLAWLPKFPEPVRHGAHSNTAFGLRRILAAARALVRTDVEETIVSAARRFYLADTRWPFAYERSGQDFLSPGLCEADLMVDVLTGEERRRWLAGFLTELTPDSAVLSPREVLDPTDGYQVHLYGLGLSTAAAAARVAKAAYLGDPARFGKLVDAVTSRTAALISPGLQAAVGGDYMSTHWLATFAWEAIQASRPSAEE